MSEIQNKIQEFKIFKKNLGLISFNKIMLCIYAICISIILGFTKSKNNTEINTQVILSSILFITSVIYLGYQIINYQIKSKKLYKIFLKNPIILENKYFTKMKNENVYLTFKTEINVKEYENNLKKINEIKNTEQYKKAVNEYNVLKLLTILEEKLQRKDLGIVKSEKKIYTMYISKRGYIIKYY